MIVDSSVWLEIFRAGPLQTKCEDRIHKGNIKVPTIVVFEVYKKIKSRISEETALEAVAFLSKHQILDLDREIALLAADLSLTYNIGMADSFVLAHAQFLDEPLITLDNDFSHISRAVVIR